MSRFALGVVLVLALNTAANASIIYEFTSMSGSGPFTWVYTASLSADQKINTVGPSGQPSFGTIFDFPGTVSVTSVALVGTLTATSTLMGTSPHAFNQSSPDNPAIPNVVTTLSGTFTPAVQTNIFTVTIISTVGGPIVFPGEFQEAQAIKNTPGVPSDNSLTGNTAQIEGPARAAVPEAGTLLLIGTGLVGLAGFARRVRTN